MTTQYPLLPLRDIVVFPQMIVPLFVGRDKSVAALESAMEGDKEIFLVSQLDPAEDDPGEDSLYDTGVIAVSDDPEFVARLYRSGAWLVLRFDGLIGCLDPTKKELIDERG